MAPIPTLGHTTYNRQTWRFYFSNANTLCSAWSITCNPFKCNTSHLCEYNVKKNWHLRTSQHPQHSTAYEIIWHAHNAVCDFVTIIANTTITSATSFHFIYNFPAPAPLLAKQTPKHLRSSGARLHDLNLQTSWAIDVRPYGCTWADVNVFIGPRLIRKCARKSPINRASVIILGVINHT